MVAFIILIVALLPGVIACWWCGADWEAIEEDNRRYYTDDGHHIYYDRKLIAQLEKERQQQNQMGL